MQQCPPRSLCNEEHKESFAEKSSLNDTERNTCREPSTAAHLKCTIRRLQRPCNETFLRSPRVKHHKSCRIPPCSRTEALLKGCTVKKTKNRAWSTPQGRRGETVLKRCTSQKTQTDEQWGTSQGTQSVKQIKNKMIKHSSKGENWKTNKHTKKPAVRSTPQGTECENTTSAWRSTAQEK